MPPLRPQLPLAWRGKEPQQLASDERRGRRVLHQQIDNVFAAKSTAATQKTLAAVVVLATFEYRFDPFTAPAGKGAGRFEHVLFRVVADPAGEQLHQFAGEILVRMIFRARFAVEPDEHGRIARHASDQVVQIRPGSAAQGLDLPVHKLRILDLMLAGGEMAVPEQRQLLAQRRLGGGMR